MSTTSAVAADLELGGVPPVEALRRVRQAGIPYALVPGRPDRQPPARIELSGPVAVILAGVPLHDIGGGSRGAQLAFELLAQGFEVIYVHRYGLASVGEDLGLRFIHPGLHVLLADQLDADVWSRLPAESLVIVEFPLDGYREAAASATAAGHRVIYDAIDDWSDPALGLEWYRPEVEAELARRARGVVASAPDLVSRIERLAGTSARLVPNAVNTRLFDGSPMSRPHDMPEAERVLVYHGSLYGHWFDWEAVRRLAMAEQQWAVVLIGPVAEPPAVPDNVHLLGPRPQHELPAYLAHADVGLVPFVVSDMTHAVSPLKVYEYLACAVPVAAPPLRSLAGLPGVHVATDLVDAARAAVRSSAPDAASVRAAHGWERRVAEILDAAGLAAPGGGRPPRAEVRPVQRHSLRERLADWL